VDSRAVRTPTSSREIDVVDWFSGTPNNSSVNGASFEFAHGRPSQSIPDRDDLIRRFDHKWTER